MRIAIANDHAAVELKNSLCSEIEALGHEVINFGTDTADSVDYPDFGRQAAEAVAKGEADLAVLICGTGIGMSLTANKVKGIRCCACSEPYSAKLSRQHNNANALAIGARVIGDEVAKFIVREFITTEFEGGRHQRRIDKVMEIESSN